MKPNKLANKLPGAKSKRLAIFGGALAVIVASSYFLFWRLGELFPGLAQAELAAAGKNTDLSQLLDYPSYPLHSLLQWLSWRFFTGSSFSLRLASVVLAMVTFGLLFWLLNRWLKRPVALLTIVLVASADWWLGLARSASGGIEAILWSTLALLSITQFISKRSSWWLVGLALSLGSLLLLPYGLFFVGGLLACLLGFRQIRQLLLKASSVPRGVALAVLGLAVIIFGLQIWLNRNQMANLLLGTSQLPDLSQYATNLLYHLGFFTALLPDSWSGLAPTGFFMVRFFEVLFAGFGLVVLLRTRVNRLNISLIVGGLISLLIASLSPPSQTSIGLLFVPFVLALGTGLRHFLYRWQRVFPNNPYGRLVANVFVLLLVAANLSLNHFLYFRLWPNQTETYAIFDGRYSSLRQEVGRSPKPRCLIVKGSQFAPLLLANKFGCRLQFIEHLPRSLGADQLVLSPVLPKRLTERDLRYHAVPDSTTNSRVYWWLITSAPGQDQ